MRLRSAAYAELAAILQLEAPEKTAVCIFADKEEIGSEGVSGMQSEAFEHFMEKLCRTQNVPLTDCLAKSFCISADVTAAYDPNFAEVYEKRNASYLNYGIGLCKYTGAGGKSGASDASAEVVGRLRKLFNDNGVMWQMAELGKTDAGGGGTVAKYMAKRNIDTLDAGVPVLSMHAPYETVAKLDLLSCGPLTFDPIDEAAFPCFALAKEAAKTGGTACTAMNAANEEAVALYLQDRIGFYDIPDAVAAALRLPVTAEPSLDDIFEADRLARAYTRERFSDR